MLQFLADLLASLNQILTAAIVVTAVSLLLYSLTFNLHDRVARSYSGMLVAISAVFLGDVMASLTLQPAATGNWLRNVQTGYLRSYVLFLALAAMGLFVLFAAYAGAVVK